MSDQANKKTLAERGVDWVFQQGTSTILLLLVFVWGYNEIPKHLQAIQSGYEKLASKFEAEQEKNRTTFSESIKVMREEHRLDRQNVRDTARNNP